MRERLHFLKGHFDIRRQKVLAPESQSRYRCEIRISPVVPIVSNIIAHGQRDSVRNPMPITASGVLPAVPTSLSAAADRGEQLDVAEYVVKGAFQKISTRQDSRTAWNALNSSPTTRELTTKKPDARQREPQSWAGFQKQGNFARVGNLRPALTSASTSRSGSSCSRTLWKRKKNPSTPEQH